MKLTLGDLRDASRGTIVSGDAAAAVGAICTDTRILAPGQTFVALDGANFRGDQFVPQALAQGAVGVVSSAASLELPPNVFHLQVADTQTALGDIANLWRRRLDPTVVALAGSAGKTTTKEMTAHLLGLLWKTLATVGNLNNLIGLPQTLLRLTPEHEFAVIETGMNQVGELRRLTEIADPDIVVMTNIGNAHIGNFGDLETLTRAKGDILDAMRTNGIALLNADCPNVRRLPKMVRTPTEVRWYGTAPDADIRAENIVPIAPFGYGFDIVANGLRVHVELPVYGRYQVSNALAATAVALTAGVSLHQVSERLRTFEPPKLRSQTEMLDGVFVVCDCYNASPDATIKSLRSLCDVVGMKRRIALLGDINELGAQSESLHRQVGQVVAETKLDLLCTLGRQALWIAEEAKAAGIETREFSDGEEAAKFLADELQAGDALLVKASRTVGLERVAARFAELRSMKLHGEIRNVPSFKGH